jgi:trimeric autotransporter adhesin
MICLRYACTLAALLTAVALGGCSNGRGSVDSGEQVAPPKVSIGGTVNSLVGSGLVLQNNGADDLAITANGAFSFPTTVDAGTPYNVTIKTPPTNPTQTCSIANPSGSAGTSNVTSVTVNCATGSFSVGGTVAGLAGSGLVLRNNGADDLAIASNGSFTFATELASGSTYEVTVATQPGSPPQTCTIADASGTVGSTHVRTVKVTCATATFAIRGTVAGLEGKGLVLQNNGGDDIQVETSGGFAFPTAIPSGSGYQVTVKAQPANPTQACSVQNGSGTVTTAEVTNIVVTCATQQFTVGGTVTGLAGTGFVLLNNGGDPLTVTADGSFTFPTAVLSGRSYSVSIGTPPTQPQQECTVSNGAGTVGAGNVTSVAITCRTIGFSIGGTVSGLLGSGMALQNNGADTLSIAADGAFTLPTPLPQGSPYNVTVAAQPSNPTQACAVANGSGAVGTSNVTNVAVSCVTSSFRVRGTTSNLFGFGLQLTINGGETINVAPGSNFDFPTPLLSGSQYNVTISRQPFFPGQNCTVQNGSGTIGGGDVTNVVVSC